MELPKMNVKKSNVKKSVNAFNYNKMDAKKSNKKKILLLSDDVRLKSGVGTVSREMIRGTLHKYDWVQLGGALKHPDDGQGPIDYSENFISVGAPNDSSVKIYPSTGYGTPHVLRTIIKAEEPDAVNFLIKVIEPLLRLPNAVTDLTPLLFNLTILISYP